MGHYRLLEHTADIGVELEGETLPELFRQAARSFPALLNLVPPAASTERAVSLKADSVEELLVSWYNELVYLLEQGWIAVDVRLTGLTPESLEGTVCCALNKPQEELREVKAATWHQLEVRRTDEGWRARIYLDL